MLLILPVIPDLDVIGFHYGIAYSHPLGHRGFTHSLTFAALCGGLGVLLVGWGLVLRLRSRIAVFVLCFVATASHGVLDAFTDAGLGVGFFIPFDNSRYFFPWRPIETSPLSIGAFFSARGVTILANELIWLGPPIAIVAVAGWTYRRRKR